LRGFLAIQRQNTVRTNIAKHACTAWV
jgi:hypothetical protein